MAYMKAMGRITEMFETKDDYRTYTAYIFGSLLPELARMRGKGELQKSVKKKMEYVHQGKSYQGDYEGEVNELGLAHGVGVLDLENVQMKATFVNGKVEGVCVSSYYSPNDIFVKEHKDGAVHGKGT